MTASRLIGLQGSPLRGASRAARRIALSVALVALMAGGAQGTIIQFAATIDGAQETPPTGSPSVWSGAFVMDTNANTLSISVIQTGPPLVAVEVGAHIHGFAPPGTPAGILFSLPPGSPKTAVWSFLEAQEANIIAGLTYVNIHSAAFPGGEVRGQILRTPSCGDGFLDGGEDCDDGNTENGDCCDSSCSFEAIGSTCAGSSLCTELGECDGAGSCIAAPRTGCKTALKSILLLKDDADDNKDKLIWKWIKGEATAQADFGLPTGTTNYALCIYAGTVNSLIAEPEVPADSMLWQPISTKGFKYKDPSGASDGIQTVLLKGGDAGKAKALVKGKGSGLPDPTLDLPLPVTAQLVNSANNVCFEGSYDTADVITNTTQQFKAKAE